MWRKYVVTAFALFRSNACPHTCRVPQHFSWAVFAPPLEERFVCRAKSWATPWGRASAKGAPPLKETRTEFLCPSSKFGHCSLTLVIVIRMGALSHPKVSAQKMDPRDDILNFHFPFKCHLDLFFLSPTLLHTNCIQLQGVSENITLAWE